MHRSKGKNYKKASSHPLPGLVHPRLPPDVVTAAQERGRKLDLWQTAAELLEEITIKVN